MSKKRLYDEDIIMIENDILDKEQEQPCDCDLSDNEIGAIKRLQGTPVEPEPGYDYEKFSRLKLAVVVSEGVMRGSGWKKFITDSKKYLEPLCATCA